MGSLYDIKRKFKPMLLALIGGLVLCYFLYHAFQGERSVLALVQLHQRVQQAELRKSKLAGERRALENSIQLLCCNGQDRDLLDERARLLAGLGHSEELIIYIEPDTF